MKRNALRRLMLICFGGTALFAQPVFAQGTQGIGRDVPSGASAAKAAAEAEEEMKDPEYGTEKKNKERFTHGKKRGSEAIESKPSTGVIQKNKDGSADVTVPTGVFKDSLLDVDLPNQNPAAKPTPTPAQRANPLRRAKVEAQPAASPGANPAAAASPAPLTSSPLDITLGVSPAPTATPVPQSH